MLDQRLTVITLGAEDYPRLKKFYEDILGWQPLTQNKDIAFFQLNGVLLSICDRKLLADFIGVDARGSGFRSVTLSYNVGSAGEVTELYNRLKDQVHILKEPAAPPFGGLYFYFSDPEGNILEVATNPYVILDENLNAAGHLPIEDL